MLEAEARGAAITAIVRLKEGHTGATHMSHQQNTGRGSTAFTTSVSQKCRASIDPLLQHLEDFSHTAVISHERWSKGPWGPPGPGPPGSQNHRLHVKYPRPHAALRTDVVLGSNC
ncbi:unnamed protein product [Gadus morhua 'NCC']